MLPMPDDLNRLVPLLRTWIESIGIDDESRLEACTASDSSDPVNKGGMSIGAA